MRGQAISYRSQLLLASAILALGLVPGCGVLNPELIGSLGADPGRLSVDNSGHVLIVMNNLTPGSTQLSYDSVIAKGGGETFNRDGILFAGGNGYVSAFLPCPVTSVTLSTVSVDLSPDLDQPTTEPPADDETNTDTTPNDTDVPADDTTDDNTDDTTDDTTSKAVHTMQDAPDDGDEPGDEFELQLAVDSFDGPDLACGAVVFVNVVVDPTSGIPVATAQLVR
jgi:hypothetical protein